MRAARRVQAAGGATGTVMTDRRRAAGRRAREMAATMRARAQLGRDESSRAIRRVTGDLADLAESAAAQATAVLRNGRRAIPKALSGRMRGRLRRALGELAVTIGRTATVAAQARSRLAGQMPGGATRLVSLHDPDARPIRKGRIDKPVEFGYKAQVIDNDDGIILDYGVQAGNPPDAPQLAPAVSQIARRAGRTPRSVTADRGYGEPATERDLQALGVRTVAIPRRARPPAARRAIEHARGFRKLVKWRTGCEGRISYLKHRYGWDRTRLDGRQGASIWCGHGSSPTTWSRPAPSPDDPTRPDPRTPPVPPPEISLRTFSGRSKFSSRFIPYPGFSYNVSRLFPDNLHICYPVYRNPGCKGTV